MGEGVQKWNSRKLGAAIATILTTIFGFDIPQEMMVEIVQNIALVYIGVQGTVDGLDKLRSLAESRRNDRSW